ncbi:AzlC family ABC transporter permease [Macrococcus lamae]|uniref:Branched-chain amino acid transporter AzlC n=1 Tax=Macrococcus lamae TaxID=198484 RepID=A0A4R6BTH5_9STAP|nr:AzlC family ABC transporter permease [Macrococcus lamae]TDM07951.1 branched-chain amino acid transporter AzlC [Macrococcus lamae]
MNSTEHRQAIKLAFPPTIPIMAGFLFLGLTYGIYMHSLGHPPYFAVVMATFILAGSMEFVAGVLLLSSFNPVSAILITLAINARHLFYGIAMLDRFKGTGRKKWYLIYGMCDEAFVVNQTIKIPDGYNKGWVMFYVTLFIHSYWVIGTTLGSVLGTFITIDLSGLEFVLAALFLVIFLDQWLNGKRTPASIGLVVSVICLMIFGKDFFLLPSLIIIVAVLYLFQRPLRKTGESS